MGIKNQEFAIGKKGQLLSGLRWLLVSVLLITPALSMATILGPTPDGGEFQVNQTINSDQHYTAVDYAPDGSYVAAWETNGQDGSGYAVYGRCYAADGTPTSDEFRVNTYTNNDQRRPAVKVAPDGSFVIAWHSYGADGDGWGVFFQRYDRSCASTGGETPVNSTTNNAQFGASLSIALDGHFVITWHSNEQDGSGYGVYAQLFNADGTNRGTEFRVNTTTSGHQQWPELDMDAEGNFTIAWRDASQDGNSWGVFAQRYAADGSEIGGEIQVNTETASEQRDVDVAMAADGRHIMTWHSTGGQDGSSMGVYAQRYNANGSTAGSEFKVNDYTVGEQSWPSTAMAPDGRFVISWTGAQEISGYGIYAQAYAADGSTDGNEFPVNFTTDNHQKYSNVSMGTDGRILVSWESNLQDTSGYGVYAQRYLGDEGNVNLDLAVNSPELATPGGLLSYMLEASNAGPETAWYSVVSATLPTGFGFDSFSGADWSCTVMGQELTCISLELSNGASAAFTLNLTTPAGVMEFDQWTNINFDLQPSLLTEIDPSNNAYMPMVVAVDQDNDGIANELDNDIDGDGFANANDVFPYDVTESLDTDNDGVGNNADTDDDNDGVNDGLDAFPFDASESVDTDGDGIGNNTDENDDGDSRNDDSDACPLDPDEIFDTDGDGICNNADPDDNNDGTLDENEATFIGSSSTRTTEGGMFGGSFDITLMLSMLGLLSVSRVRRRK